MEVERYRRVCQVIDRVCPHPRRPGEVYHDRVILRVYFWSVLKDRAVCWACERRNWAGAPATGPAAAPAELPSQSLMSRRLRTVGVVQALERAHAALADRFGPGPVKAIDSKPLPVGNYSKDRDAKRGRAAGEMGRGYKLHALLCGGAARHWVLAPMNDNDQVPAPGLLAAMGADPGTGGWGYVAADNQYDANPVHRAAGAANHQLVAPPRKAIAEVRDVRRNSPERLRSLDLCARPLAAAGVAGPTFGRAVLAQRGDVERAFGHGTMLGLRAPPPWVRRPHRVALWVAAKLCLQMARKLEIKGVTT